MPRVLSLIVTALMIAACQSKAPEQTDPLRADKLRTGGISAGLERALERAIINPERIAIKAKCPAQISQILGAKFKGMYECGALRVPEFHDRPNGKFLAVSYLKIRADKRQTKPLLVIEQGGPGFSSMVLAAIYATMSNELARDFDLLAVDQRGSSWTRPRTDCPEVESYNLAHINGGRSGAEAARLQSKCREGVDRVMDLDSISTYQIATDIVHAAKQHGYSKFSFMGVSYGTLVGQYLLRHHPEYLDRTVLDSAVIPGHFWAPEALKNTDFVVKKNIEAYVEYRVSKNLPRQTFEEAMGDINSLSQNFARNPMQVSYSHGGKKYRVRFDEAKYNAALIPLLTSIFNPETLFLFIESARYLPDSDKMAKLMAPLVLSMTYDPDSSTSIMYQSLVCREFSVDEEAIALAVQAGVDLRKAFNPDEWAAINDVQNQGFCSLGFEQNADPKILRAPISTAKSVLVVGGEVDHVTPPMFIDTIVRDFSNVQTGVFKGMGHGLFGRKECITNSIVGYLKSGSFTKQCE